MTAHSFTQYTIHPCLDDCQGRSKDACLKTLAQCRLKIGLFPGLSGEKDNKAGNEHAQRLIGSTYDCASEAGASESDASAVWSPRSCMARLHSKSTKGSSAGRHSLSITRLALHLMKTAALVLYQGSGHAILHRAEQNLHGM